MFNYCHHSRELIYYPIIELHTSIGYDNISNKYTFQGDGVKVKITDAIFLKKLLHQSSLDFILFHTNV